jgi:hypothetical protein
MLNWDEYNKEEAQAAPAIKSAIPEEAKQAQPLVKEAPAHAESAPSNVEEGSRAEMARKAIENFDESEALKSLMKCKVRQEEFK